MIESVSIKNLRGIREGTLEGLRPLSILVGPNSSGKSTVLDALLIGANPSPEQGVGQAVERRSTVERGARWLFWRLGEGGPTFVDVRTGTGTKHRSVLSLRDDSSSNTVLIVQVEGNSSGHVRIGSNNRFEVVASSKRQVSDLSEVRLIEPKGVSDAAPIHDLYSHIVERGRRAEVTALLGALVPGMTGIEILTDQGNPVAHLVYADHSVPVGLTGDGIQALLRMTLELAARRSGLVLIEEPEVHQHPAAIRQTARAIVAAVRREIQVVLSTHSLELIDALVGDLKDDELDLLALYRLKLEDGVLRSSRLDGKSVLDSRGEIGDDLR